MKMEQINNCKELDEIKDELIRLLETLRPDAEKFYTKKQQAAGVRLRKGYKMIKGYVDSVSKKTLNKEIK